MSIAIITVLIGLLLPAIQYTRESARVASCRNNLRQLGIATLSHEAIFRRLPSNGWGWGWLGDLKRNTGQSQPGGWAFNLLPQLELNDVRKMPLSGSETKLCQFQPSVLVCPSRRGNDLLPQRRTIPFRNGENLELVAKTDYAANEGDFVSDTDEGPATLLDGDNPSYQWKDTQKITGVIYLRSELPLSFVRDGLSNTYLFGEKHVERSAYQDWTDPGFDACAFCGVDLDLNRWGLDGPYRDSVQQAPRAFGGPHASGVQFVFVDGSVRTVDFSIDYVIHRRLSNRHDGQPVDLP